MPKINILPHYQLKINDIQSICKLKNTHWKYGMQSQIEWFKNNVKPNDIHIMLRQQHDIIGYTLLRKRRYELIPRHVCLANTTQSAGKKNFYLLLDTLIIDPAHRKKNLSTILMNKNINIIEHSNLLAFLMCKDELIDYYQQFNWILLNNNSFQVMDKPVNSKGMIYNKKKLQLSKISSSTILYDLRFYIKK